MLQAVEADHERHSMDERDSFSMWTNGRALAVGREIMQALSPPEQVRRVAAVLDVCRRSSAPVPEVDAVSTAARHPSRWRDGHDLFDRVRDLTLIEEKSRTSNVYRALLYVAEIAAKTVYNASGEPAPFDNDSPWWIAQCALDFVNAVGTADVRAGVWRALNDRS
jgi:hypothetical protein